MKNNTVIFGQPWGGLGDNLAYSNLPKLYNNAGIKFKVSYFNSSRNREIFNFVWKNNKYYKGRSFLFPNVGSNISLKNDIKVDSKFNIVQNINIKHGFEPGDGYPLINLDSIVLNNERKFDTVADLSGYSIFKTAGLSYDVRELDEIKEKLINEGTSFLNYNNLKRDTMNLNNKANKNLIQIDSISNLVKILSNTDIFICLNSGSHVVAATLKNLTGYPKKIISYYPGLDSGKKVLGNYLFDNVKYINTAIKKNKKAKPSKKILLYSRFYDYIN